MHVIIIVSIPFIAGQWSLPPHSPHGGKRRLAFQSPSLRGSGRFHRRTADAHLRHPGFNPLHCGAVVASRARRDAERRAASFNPLHCGAVVASHVVYAIDEVWLLRVSIPFIAGQWSLPLVNALRRALPALVSIPFIAGQWSLRKAPIGAGSGHRVSIPFIAGQWSLLFVIGSGDGGFDMFQSPSLRGSGRFGRTGAAGSAAARFNPLHCGAVVASRVR